MAVDAIGPCGTGTRCGCSPPAARWSSRFPTCTRPAFSGFYLALMLVLWLLLLRGLSIEFRHQVDNELWKQAWDVTFCLASALLALLFGVALGNVLRGVPLDASGEFRGTFSLLLNPFSVLAGLLSVAVLSMHGAAWVALKTEGDLQARARRFSRGLWIVAMALLVAMVAASVVVRPDFDNPEQPLRGGAVEETPGAEQRGVDEGAPEDPAQKRPREAVGGRREASLRADRCPAGPAGRTSW
jgi:cytochrome bd ubiquinol oxidase subunit II